MMPARKAVLLAALLFAAPGVSMGCIRGSLGTCLPEPGTRIAPLSREDLNARIGNPGPPVLDAVRRDMARTWEAVRRRPQPPAIAYQPSSPQDGTKGDTP